jgi:tryptophanyl-tRNA synthetase
MIFLTGIKPSFSGKVEDSIGGGFHLGNYVSTIKPIKDFLAEGNTGYVFIADAHALNMRPEPMSLNDNVKKMAKLLMAFFQDDIVAGKLRLYRQSMISETFELSFILSQFCAKGFLNRMHLNKSLQDDNKANNRDIDWGINAGHYFYPLLMAVDIVQLDAAVVPVGQDQLAHIEVAQAMARVANNFFKKDVLVVPNAHVQTEVVLPGIDGRKMSKSYNNTIQLFENENKLKKLVYSIPTNAKNVGEPKFAGESDVTTIYKELATPVEYSALLDQMKEGMGWGDIKGLLFSKILEITKDAKKVYNELTDDALHYILTQNEHVVREKVSQKLQQVKTELGLWV